MYWHSNFTVSSSWTQYTKRTFRCFIGHCLLSVHLSLGRIPCTWLNAPRPSFSIFAYSKWSKTGGRAGLEIRLLLEHLGTHAYPCLIISAGCREPTPPSRGSINNFQSAAEGATITYSCSPGLVPRTQMSAVCTNMAWRPDPATLQCREPGKILYVCDILSVETPCMSCRDRVPRLRSNVKSNYHNTGCGLRELVCKSI